jgi:hypothetical protein
MNPQRRNLDAVLLPTGEVFVEGGAKDSRDDATGVKKAEMFDPEDPTRDPMGSWRVLPEAQEVRNYHSVALLMPNGAVWVAGSNFNSSTGLSNRNLWIEIYEPWYFCHRRPRITTSPPAVCVGTSFDISVDDANNVDRVVLIRAGSATHNFNPDQRLVECTFEPASPTRLSVQAPPDSAVAPPGTYLIFVLTDERVPSHGEFIKVCRQSSLPPRPDWSDWFDDWIIDAIRWRLRDVTRIPPKPEPWPPRPPGDGDDREPDDWIKQLTRRAGDALRPLQELAMHFEIHEEAEAKDD